MDVSETTVSEPDTHVPDTCVPASDFLELSGVKVSDIIENVSDTTVLVSKADDRVFDMVENVPAVCASYTDDRVFDIVENVPDTAG